MSIKPIRTEADYDAALTDVEKYFDRPPAPGSAAADRFDVLATLIEAYERERWPIDSPKPVDAIRYRMEIGGFNQSDLARLIGSRSRASEILSGKRSLTLPMIRRLHAEWNIPLESLIEPIDARAA